MVEMDLVLEAVVRAPVGLRFEKAVSEHEGENVVVIGFRTELLRVEGDVSGLQEGREKGRNVIALLLLKPPEELRSPRVAGDGVIRLVTTKAKDGSAELGTNGVLVGLMGEPGTARSRQGQDSPRATGNRL
jgi:hypothetical protein